MAARAHSTSSCGGPRRNSGCGIERREQPGLRLVHADGVTRGHVAELLGNLLVLHSEIAPVHQGAIETVRSVQAAMRLLMADREVIECRSQ